MNNLPANILFLRKSLNKNQTQMSAAAGFNRAAWGNYETGASQPVIRDALKIAKYFGITLTQLIEEDISKDVGLINEIVTAINSGKSRAKSRPIGRAKDKKGEDIYIPNESDTPYLLSKEVVEKRLQEKDDLIAAQKGQIEALKMAISQIGKSLQKK